MNNSAGTMNNSMAATNATFTTLAGMVPHTSRREALYRKEIHLMNHTTKFFLSAAVEGHFYQTAFFMLVHDVARLAALGKSPKAAFDAAKLAVKHLGLSKSEQAQFDDLMQIWHDDRHIETTFLMNGKTETAKVSWIRIDRYPTVS